MGLDYSHTFGLVVKASTMHIVLSLTVLNKWRLHQLDVKNAFLNGHLAKRVFMEHPPGFVNPDFPNHVCKLSKALYGLKQAPRAVLMVELVSFGLRVYPSLFIYKHGSSIIYLLAYVDDMILTRNNEVCISAFVSRLNSEFTIKDLGDLNYFLGLEVSYTEDGFFLCQSKYVSEILKRAELFDSKPATTPLSPHESFVSDGKLFVDVTLYRSLMRALQYLNITRPDLSYAAIERGIVAYTGVFNAPAQYLCPPATSTPAASFTLAPLAKRRPSKLLTVTIQLQSVVSTLIKHVAFNPPPGLQIDRYIYFQFLAGLQIQVTNPISTSNCRPFDLQSLPSSTAIIRDFDGHWLLLASKSWKHVICIHKQFMWPFFHITTFFEKALTRIGIRKISVNNNNSNALSIQHPLVSYLPWMLPPQLKKLKLDEQQQHSKSKPKENLKTHQLDISINNNFKYYLSSAQWAYIVELAVVDLI